MLLILTSNGNSLRNYGKRKKKKKTKLGGGERSAFSDQYLGDLVAEADEKVNGEGNREGAKWGSECWTDGHGAFGRDSK